MNLFLLNKNDVSGNWLFEMLAQQDAGIRKIYVEELLMPQKCSLTLSNTNDDFEWKISEQLTLSKNDIGSVINRIRYLPNSVVNTFVQSDRNYVCQELQAILLCFLHTLKHKIIFNRARPVGLSGCENRIETWLRMAHQAGLHTYSFSRMNAETTGFIVHKKFGQSIELIVFSNRCFGHSRIIPLLPLALKEQLQNLLELSGEDIIGVSLFFDGEHFYFQSATSFPDLRTGETALCKAVAETILNKQYC